MDKIISWFIIMFIGLVPLGGAFFDTKQPPKPNMKQQSFMKREKRATNPSQCGNSCKLEFFNIYNSFLIPSKIGGGAKIKFQDNIDLPLEIKKTRTFSLSLGNKNKDWINFYKNNGVKKTYDDFSYLDSDFGYQISEIINVKITFTKSIRLSYSITSFYAEMPPLPEKEAEQPATITYSYWIIKNDGEYQYNQFQDKLDYLMIQRRDFDKFNYSYLYWVPIFNFFDDNFKYMSEMSIKLNGFKQNSKFNLGRKNSYPRPDMMEKVIFRELSFSSFGDVITIKTEHGSIVGNNEFLENGKSLWKSGSQTSFGEDFINTFLDKLIIMVILSIFYAMMTN